MTAIDVSALPAFVGLARAATMDVAARGDVEAAMSPGDAPPRLAPRRALLPDLAMFLTVMGFDLPGDGLRDAFDPRAL